MNLTTEIIKKHWAIASKDKNFYEKHKEDINEKGWWQYNLFHTLKLRAKRLLDFEKGRARPKTLS